LHDACYDPKEKNPTFLLDLLYYSGTGVCNLVGHAWCLRGAPTRSSSACVLLGLVCCGVPRRAWMWQRDMAHACMHVVVPRLV
jgi:hypothetical protein